MQHRKGPHTWAAAILWSIAVGALASGASAAGSPLFEEGFATGELAPWQISSGPGTGCQIVPDGHTDTPALALFSLTDTPVKASRQWRASMTGPARLELRVKADLSRDAKAVVELISTDDAGRRRSERVAIDAGFWRDVQVTCGAAEPLVGVQVALSLAGPGRVVVDDIRIVGESATPMVAAMLVAEKTTLLRESDAVRGTTRVRNAGDKEETYLVKTRLVHLADPNQVVGETEASVTVPAGDLREVTWDFPVTPAHRAYWLATQALVGETPVASQETVIVDERRSFEAGSEEGGARLAPANGLWRISFEGDGYGAVPVSLPVRMVLPAGEGAIRLTREFSVEGLPDGAEWDLVLRRPSGPSKVFIDGREMSVSCDGARLRTDGGQLASDRETHELAVVLSGAPGGLVGMDRGVRLQTRSAISEVQAATAKEGVRVRCRIGNAGDAAATYSLDVQLLADGALLGEGKSSDPITLAAGQERWVDVTVPTDRPAVWQAGAPAFCDVVVRLHHDGLVAASRRKTVALYAVGMKDGMLAVNADALPLRIGRLDGRSRVWADQRDFLRELGAWRARHLNTLLASAGEIPGQLADACDLAGCVVIGEVGPETSAGALRSQVSALTEHPSMVAWMIARGVEPAAAARLREIIREVDPVRPIAAWTPGQEILVSQGMPEDKPGEGGGASIVLGAGADAPSNRDEAALYLGDRAYVQDNAVTLARKRYYEQVARECRSRRLAGFELVADDAESRRIVADVLQTPRLFFESDQRSFSAGQKSELPVIVPFDRQGMRKAELQWRLDIRDRRIAGGDASEKAATGTTWSETLDFDAPATGQRGPMTLTVTVDDGEGEFVSRRTLYDLARPPKLLRETSVGLIDPSGTVAGPLEKLGATVQPISEPEALSEASVDLLVVGPLEDARRDAFERAILAFARKGGYVLVLPQTRLGDAFAAWGSPDDRPASGRVFIQAWAHPVAEGLEEVDLFFGDALGPTIPLRGRAGARALLVSPDASGRLSGVLVEAPAEAGVVLFCQIDLVEALARFPAAGWLLHNILTYAQTCPAKARVRASLLSSEGVLADAVAAFSPPVRVSELSENHRAALIDGATRMGNDEWTQLVQWVRAGGLLYVYNLDSVAAKHFAEALDREMGVEPFNRTATAANMTDAILWGISRRWFTWSQAGAVLGSVTVEDARDVISPGVLVVLAADKGVVVLDQVRWCDAPPDERTRAVRYGLTLLGNLGIDTTAAEASQPAQE